MRTFSLISMGIGFNLMAMSAPAVFEWWPHQLSHALYVASGLMFGALIARR
jgi:hypothetical protein